MMRQESRQREIATLLNEYKTTANKCIVASEARRWKNRLLVRYCASVSARRTKPGFSFLSSSTKQNQAAVPGRTL